MILSNQNVRPVYLSTYASVRLNDRNHCIIHEYVLKKILQLRITVKLSVWNPGWVNIIGYDTIY